MAGSHCALQLKHKPHVISKKLEHPHPHTPTRTLNGIPALIILQAMFQFSGAYRTLDEEPQAPIYNLLYR